MTKGTPTILAGVPFGCFKSTYHIFLSVKEVRTLQAEHTSTGR